jgi:hypothetical protein
VKVPPIESVVRRERIFGVRVSITVRSLQTDSRLRFPDVSILSEYLALTSKNCVKSVKMRVLSVLKIYVVVFWLMKPCGLASEYQSVGTVLEACVSPNCTV